jgi:DNA-binding CsgD family transcriptional regulator
MGIKEEITRYDVPKMYFKNGEPDYSVFEKKLEVLKSVTSVTNTTVYIRDLYKNTYPYISNFPFHLIGYTQEELYGFGSQFFGKLLCKEEINFILGVEEKIYTLIYSLESEKRPYYVLSISHNLVHKDGSLLPVHVYITPFLFDDDNHVWMTLARVSPGNKNNKYKRFLYIDMLDSNKRYVYNIEKGEFELQNRPCLTHMEKSILVLSIKGYMEKEIAQNLDISINTVKTHKRNFLRKLDAENTSEAIIMATIHKLI